MKPIKHVRASLMARAGSRVSVIQSGIGMGTYSRIRERVWKLISEARGLLP